MNLLPSQFYAAYADVRQKVMRSDFGFRERKVLLVILEASFGSRRTHAIIQGHDVFVRCRAVTSKTHIGAIIMDLAKRLVLEYRQEGRAYWVYNFRVPLMNWRVDELPRPELIREQLHLDVFPPDLNNEQLNTYIGNLRILPNRDGGCIDRGTDMTARDEELHRGSAEGKSGNAPGMSATQGKWSNNPPAPLQERVSLFVPREDGGAEAHTQAGKENMHEKESGQCPDETLSQNQTVNDRAGVSGHRGPDAPVSYPLPVGADPGGGPARQVTKPVTTDGGGCPSGGGLGPVTKKVTTPTKLNVDWGPGPVTELVTTGQVTKKVTAPDVPGVFPPHTPPSKPLNAERSTLNGLWRPVRKRREQERWLMSLLQEELGSEEMTNSGGMWRVRVVRNLPEDWIEAGVGEIRRMKNCGETFSVNPAATLVDILRKRAGVKHISELPAGPPPL